MSTQPTHSNPRDRDRRGSERFSTNHSAHYGAARGGPLKSGVVADMGTGGLRLLGQERLPVGSVVEVEFYPAPAAALEVVCGRVKYSVRLEDGRCAMGIDREYALEPVAAQSIELLGAKAAQPLAAVPVLTRPVSTTRTAKARYRVVQEPARPRHQRRYAAAAAVVLLTLLLFGGVSLLPDRDRPEPGRADSARSERIAAADLPVEPLPSNLLDSHRDADRLQTVPDPNDHPVLDSIEVQSDTPAAELSRVQAALASSVGTLDTEALEHLAGRTAAANPEKFIARLAQARAVADRGEVSLAKKLLRDALAQPGGIGEVWVDEARQALSNLRRDPLYRPETAPMDTRLTLSNRPAALESEPVAIEVDVSAYELHVLRNGRRMRSFPIGLGRGGATPIGRFTVINKIRDPDWYDRGRIVPSGDPENPLGANWMGIGRDGAGDGIGIHPTGDGSSVEQPMSRGCIRMRPADADELFRLAPVGTSVDIHR